MEGPRLAALRLAGVIEMSSASLPIRARIPSTAAVDYAAMPGPELVRACADYGNAAAWQEFIRRYHRIIAITAGRIARRCGPAVIDEIVQETFLKLCRNNQMLRDFDTDAGDRVHAFMRKAAANVALDHLRRREPDTEPLEPFEESGKSPAIDPTAAVDNKIFFREVDEILCSLLDEKNRERDRTIFWLRYRQGFTAKEIATDPSFGLTLAGVESILLRLATAVRASLAENRRPKQRAKGKAQGEGN